jgi:hypothetical protein
MCCLHINLRSIKQNERNWKLSPRASAYTSAFSQLKFHSIKLTGIHVKCNQKTAQNHKIVAWMSFRPTRLPQPTIGGMNVSVSYLCELVFSEPIINFTIPSRLSRRHTDSERVREMGETSHKTLRLDPHFSIEAGDKNCNMAFSVSQFRFQLFKSHPFRYTVEWVSFTLQL